MKKPRDIHQGDSVFIYETQTNPGYEENGRIITRPIGRKGVIALVTVNDEIQQHDHPQEKLEDGTLHEWNYIAKTHLERECYIPLDRVRQALGWLNWCARGYSGIWELSPEQFVRLVALI
ncbi:hypothetical protein ACFLYQ_06765 [Chloroflexota bacterium]